VRSRSGRGRGEEGRTPKRGESDPDEEEAVPTLGQAESYEPPSRPHRRVSFPFARAHEKKTEENEPC